MADAVFGRRSGVEDLEVPPWARTLKSQLHAIENKLDSLTQTMASSLASGTTVGSPRPLRTSPRTPRTARDVVLTSSDVQEDVISAERATEADVSLRNGQDSQRTISHEWWNGDARSSKLPNAVTTFHQRLAKACDDKKTRAPGERLWRIANSAVIQALSAIVIMLNVAFISMGTDNQLRVALNGQQASPAWLIAEAAFCGYFSLELLLRLVAEEILFFCGDSWRWNAFDSFVLVCSIADVIIGAIAERHMPAAWLVRSIRFFRIARIGRALRVFHKLRVMVYAVYESMASLAWCFVVIGLAIYVFAVLFVTAVSNGIEDLSPGAVSQVLASYGSTLRACQTLFQAVSGGVDWGDAMAPLADLGRGWEVAFTCYIFFMVIGLLNVVVGAFVATTGDIVAKDRDFMIRAEIDRLQSLATRIKASLAEADTDKSGKLSRTEFYEHLRRKEVAAFFHALGLDPAGAERLFSLLDAAGEGAVNLDTFMEGCIRFQGQATSLDVNLLLVQNRHLAQKLTSYMDSMAPADM